MTEISINLSKNLNLTIMKKEKNLPDLTPDEKLKTENNLLKAKLTAEFGMKHSESEIDSELENQWLNHIYNFEKSYKDAGTVSIYEFLGKPEYKSVDLLSKKEVETELDRLYEIMNENNVILDTLCEYENEVIYKFITEEFFQVETDNMRIEGMNHCFIYEEFHPNHEYDLRNQTSDFVFSMFENKWNSDFDKYTLADNVEFNSKFYDRDSFMKFILTFQDAYKPLETISKKISKVEFDLEKGKGEVCGSISYYGNSKNYAGEFKIKFVFEDAFWIINGVKLPNFG